MRITSGWLEENDTLQAFVFFGAREATSKRKLKNRKHCPLARMVTNYYGVAMFNREHLWVCSGRQPKADTR
jgi:hypothetical protein